jgi:3-hydroxyacyl-CoA dehydrogenase
MSERVTERIRLGNFEDDFDRVGEADWIVEVIIEKLEPKKQLMERIEKTAKEDAIVSSNTSGIPLHKVAEGRSEDFKKRFLGTHFFNPPRYLKLLEIIPTADTDPRVVDWPCDGPYVPYNRASPTGIMLAVERVKARYSWAGERRGRCIRCAKHGG